MGIKIKTQEVDGIESLMRFLPISALLRVLIMTVPDRVSSPAFSAKAQKQGHPLLICKLPVPMLSVSYHKGLDSMVLA